MSPQPTQPTRHLGLRRHHRVAHRCAHRSVLALLVLLTLLHPRLSPIAPLHAASTTSSTTSSTVNSTTVITTVLDPVIENAAGGNHSLFLTSDGSAWASGANTAGQLGDGSTVDRTHPVPVMRGVIALAAGNAHSLFLKCDGSVWASGANAFGQLGDGSQVNQSEPVQVSLDALPAGVTIVALAAGSHHSLFLASDGTVWACGLNADGQLGLDDGLYADQSTPQAVSGLSQIRAIAAGGLHSLFLNSDGSVWATGENVNGQLGKSTADNIDRAVQVSGLSDITAIAAGSFHSLFLGSDGSVWAPV